MTSSSTPPTGPGSGRVPGPGGPRRARPCSRSTSPPASTPTPASPARARFARPQTVTMAALKPGLLMGDGPRSRRRASRWRRSGSPSPPGNLWLVEDADIASWLPPRERETNKWRSACVVVAGSPGMVGAARFSASGRAAGRSRHGPLVRAGRRAGLAAGLRGRGASPCRAGTSPTPCCRSCTAAGRS